MEPAMSESVSAPVADAPAADAPGPISPAPNTQPAISISDAARMLRGARTPAQAAADAAEPAAEQPPAAEPPKRGVDAMAKALGLKTAEAAPDSTEGAEPPQPAADGFELDGRRWTPDSLREQIRLAEDYTRKTQAVAEQARQVQAAQQQLRQQQQALDQFLPLIQPQVTQLQAMLADAPMPPPELRANDPAAYWDAFARHQDAIVAHQRFFAMQQQQDAARAQAQAQMVAEGTAVLAQKYPDVWGDPAARREAQDTLVTWARGIGFKDAELQSLANPLYVEVMMKAAAWDNMQAGVVTAAPTPTVRAAPARGAAPPPRPAEEIQAAQARFEAKPDWRNGAALLSAQQSASRRGNGHSSW